MITFLILLALYFLPTIIARDKQGVVGIFLLNFFLGWTFVGYIFALIWALAANPKPTQYPTVTEELMRLDHLQRGGARLLYGYA